ncbi:hypothetical protein HK104_006517, partial [Borealophlyctis nickersoniae]
MTDATAALLPPYRRRVVLIFVSLALLYILVVYSLPFSQYLNVKFNTSTQQPVVNSTPQPVVNSTPQPVAKDPFALVAGDYIPFPTNQTCTKYHHGSCPNSVYRLRYIPLPSETTSDAESFAYLTSTDTPLAHWKDVFETLDGKNLTIIGDSTISHIYDDARCYAELNEIKCSESRNSIILTEPAFDLEFEDMYDHPVDWGVQN